MADASLTRRIRADFPALQRRVNGHAAAFFDGPAGSQVPSAVIAAVSGYLAHRNANTHGAFATSLETDEMIETARARLATFLGAETSREIVFGANMTTLTFSLARVLAAEWGPGDEVVVTELDHQANVEPWRRAAENAGATVRCVPFDPSNGQLDLEALRSVVGPRTRLVAVGYASNALGTVNDVAHICGLAREAGALSFVDAVHFAPHGLIDVGAIGCDFLACSAYKFFGPHLGVLWGRLDLLERLRPWKLPPQQDEAPYRWETGTLPHECIAGAAAAVEWISSLGEPGAGATDRARIAAGMQLIDGLEAPLFRRLVDGIASIDGVRIFGPGLDVARTPTLGFTVAGASPRAVAERLGESGIFVWDGDFYATTVIDRLGLRDSGGIVRVGMAPYNTPEEVDRLLAAVTAMRAGA